MHIPRGMAKVGALCKQIVCFTQSSYPNNLLFIAMPLFCMISFLTTLKVENVHSSKPSVGKHHTGWRHILKHSNLHHPCHDNLKFYTLLHVQMHFSSFHCTRCSWPAFKIRVLLLCVSLMISASRKQSVFLNVVRRS
jgi:hypothetical protein